MIKFLSVVELVINNCTIRPNLFTFKVVCKENINWNSIRKALVRISLINVHRILLGYPTYVAKLSVLAQTVRFNKKRKKIKSFRL